MWPAILSKILVCFWPLGGSVASQVWVRLCKTRYSLFSQKLSSRWHYRDPWYKYCNDYIQVLHNPGLYLLRHVFHSMHGWAKVSEGSLKFLETWGGDRNFLQIRYSRLENTNTSVHLQFNQGVTNGNNFPISENLLICFSNIHWFLKLIFSKLKHNKIFLLISIFVLFSSNNI